MIPTHVSDAPPLAYHDRFDIPVLFRDGPAEKPYMQWRTAAHAPWIRSNGIPKADGWYAPTATWREIIKAAVEVGRDPAPQLQYQPQLAHAELVARVAPLFAYLGMHDVSPKHPLPETVHRRLTLNPVYAYGIERTEKKAAAYRLGMTMAEWACRALLNLGQTNHLELGGPVPALSGAFRRPNVKLPDLWGRHEAEDEYWLIEAKGGNVGVGTLRKGWEQLASGSGILTAYAHRTILVGASVRPGGDLFLTIDHGRHHGKPPLPPNGPAQRRQSAESGSPEDHLDDSDDALIRAARAQMLTYLALRSAPISLLRTVPVPADRTSRRQRTELVTPLEQDDLTDALREAARAE